MRTIFVEIWICQESAFQAELICVHNGKIAAGFVDVLRTTCQPSGPSLEKSRMGSGDAKDCQKPDVEQMGVCQKQS